MQTGSSSTLTGNKPLGHNRKKKATFKLDAGLHRQLKVVAAATDRDMVDILEEALRAHLRDMKCDGTLMLSLDDSNYNQQTSPPTLVEATEPRGKDSG